MRAQLASAGLPRFLIFPPRPMKYLDQIGILASSTTVTGKIELDGCMTSYIEKAEPGLSAQASKTESYIYTCPPWRWELLSNQPQNEQDESDLANNVE